MRPGQLFDRPGEFQPNGPDQIRRQLAHLPSVALGKGLTLPRAGHISAEPLWAIAENVVVLDGVTHELRLAEPRVHPDHPRTVAITPGHLAESDHHQMSCRCLALRATIVGMVAVLLAGGPGAGKSAVASALHARGLCSVDLDFGYARHEDAAGDPVAFPASPDLAWLSTHYWQWLDDRLTNALDQYRSRNALFCGTAYNMFDHLDRFALIILLRLDAQTQTARLLSPTRANIFGTTGDTATWSHWWRTKVEHELTTRNAIPIDARQPLPQVVAEVLNHCAAAHHPISPQPANH